MERYQVVFATQIPAGRFFQRGLVSSAKTSDNTVHRIEEQKATEYFPATSFDDAYRQASAFAEVGSTRIVMIREVGS